MHLRSKEVHLYNNLFTSAGNHACIQLGVDANIREEANTFVNVGDPLEIHDLSNAASVLESIGSVFRNTRGNTVGTGGRAFVPPYSYRADAAAKAETDVRAGVGPG